MPAQFKRTYKPDEERSKRIAAYRARQLQTRSALVSAARMYSRPARDVGELKFLDTAHSDGTLAANMTFYNPMVVPQGTTESSRDGRKITIKSLHIRGHATLLNATDVTNTSTIMRMRVVLDKQCNGAQFTATDLLESDAINSFANLANRGRFVTLIDRVMSFSCPGATATGGAYSFGEIIRPISINLKCNYPIEYDNSVTTGAIGSVRSNYLCIVLQTSTGELISISFTSRIRYTDK